LRQPFIWRLIQFYHNPIIDYCSVGISKWQIFYKFPKINYKITIYSRENLTTVENTVNEFFNSSVESTYFDQTEINAQTANFIQIENGPTFKAGEIAVISVFTCLGVMVILSCLCVESHDGKSCSLLLLCFVTVSIFGSMIYLGLDGTLTWEIAGAVLVFITTID